MAKLSFAAQGIDYYYEGLAPVGQAPNFIGGLSASNITASSFDVSYELDGNCTVYMIVVASGSNVPTPLQIIAGTDYDGQTVIVSSSRSAIASVPGTFNVTGLSAYAGSALTVYATCRDSDLNVQTAEQVRLANLSLSAAIVPPEVVGSFPVQSVSVGNVLVLQAAGVFSSSDALTYSITGSQAANINANTGEITFTPVSVGVYNLSVIATDTQDQSASVQLTINAISQGSYWDFAVPMENIINFNGSFPTITKDKNAQRNYWVDLKAALSAGSNIAAYSVDPDGVSADLSITDMGVNPTEITDVDGGIHAAGTLIGLTVSGGINDRLYDVLIRFTASNGEIDDRTFRIMVAER